MPPLHYLAVEIKICAKSHLKKFHEIPVGCFQKLPIFLTQY